MYTCMMAATTTETKCK